MPTKRWKKTELSVAKSIGGKREHFEDCDVSHPLFAVEVKHRSIQNYPKRLRDWFQQAIRNAGKKVPLLVIHLASEVYGNDLVVLKRRDFEELFGQLKATEQSPSLFKDF